MHILKVVQIYSNEIMKEQRPCQVQSKYCTNCQGRILGITGHQPHVEIFPFFFIKLRNVL
jgi:hypothetical protein